MQNRYVGDVGDFGKYGMLRALFGSRHRLGIVWYLVPDEQQTNDGRHIDYLNRPDFAACDPDLFEAMKTIIGSGQRHIRNVEQSGLFPPGTIYYSRPLSPDTPANRSASQRTRFREDWLQEAVQTVTGCDAVFCDPDNGLETPTVGKHDCRAVKYIFYDEVEQFLSAADTVVLYHHFSRQGSHLSQARLRTETLRKLAGPARRVLTLRFQPYSPRAYFIMTKEKTIPERIKKFACSVWKHCFQIIEQEPNPK